MSNIDHLATVLWNVIRMNGSWRGKDLHDLYDYVEGADMDSDIKKFVQMEIMKQLKENNK